MSTHEYQFEDLSISSVEDWWAEIGKLNKDDTTEYILNMTQVHAFDMIGIAVFSRRIVRLKRQENKSTITILPPINSSPAQHFFHETNILPALKSNDISFKGLSNKSPHYSFSANFESFKSIKDVNLYLSRPDNIFGVETEEQFKISNAKLKNIVLRELLENSFAHGGGDFVFFASAVVSKKFTSLPNELFNYDKAADQYLEIVASDLNQNNLEKTITSAFKNEKDWKQTIVEKLPKQSNVNLNKILYALEFSTTSNPERREEYLNKLLYSEEGTLGDKNISASQIATGLFHIHTIAKEFLGQMIIRFANVLVKVDFRSPSDAKITSKLTMRDSDNAVKVTKESGTVICLRIPLEDHATTFLPSNNRDRNTGSIEENFPKSDRKYKTIASYKNNQESNLQWANNLPRDIRELRHTHDVILDIKESDLTSKELSYIVLELISHNCPGYLYILLPSNSSYTLLKANFDQVDQAYTNRCILVPPDKRKEFFSNAKNIQAIKNHAEDYWERDGILHGKNKKELFLIEGKYYTDKFYDISTLLKNEQFSHEIQLIIECLITSIRPVLIIHNNTSFESIINEALTVLGQSNSIKQICFYRKIRMSTSLDIRRIAKKSDNILCLIDVLCTGSSLEKLLKYYAADKNTHIFSVIDARTDCNVRDKFKIEYSQEIFNLPIDSLHVDPIKAKTQIGKEQRAAKSIFRIDPITKSPNRLYTSQKDEVKFKDSLTITKNCFDAGSFSLGHRKKHAKHYLTYFDIISLLKIESEAIISFLANEFYNGVLTRNEPGDICIWVDGEFADLKTLTERAINKHRDIQRVAPIVSLNSAIKKKPDEQAKDILWVVLTGLSQGTTIQKVLKAAGLDGFARVRISVILNRSESAISEFYSSIGSYKSKRNSDDSKGREGEFELDVQPYLILNQPSYMEDRCPICTLQKQVTELANDSAIEFINISTTLDDIANELDKEAYSNGASKIFWEIIHFRIILERTRSNAEEQKQNLRDAIQTKEDLVRLIIAIGLTSKEKYIEDIVKDVLPNIEFHDQIAETFTSDFDTLKNHTVHFINGLIQYDKNYLLDNFSIFHGAFEKDINRFKTFLSICLLDQDVCFQYSVNNPTHHNSTDFEKEWQRFVANRNFSGPAIGQLANLLSLLSHTDQFSWLYVKNTIQKNVSTENCQNLIKKFIAKFQQAVFLLEKMESDWFSIDATQYNPEPQLKNITSDVLEVMQQFANSPDCTTDRNDFITDIDSKFNDLKKQADKIAKVTQFLIEDYQTTYENSLLNEFQFNCVKSNIAISCLDFEMILNALDNNNREHANACGYNLEIGKEEIGGRPFQTIFVKQNEPFREPKQLGELKTVRQMAIKYGGFLNMTPNDDAILKIALPIWPFK